MGYNDLPLITGGCGITTTVKSAVEGLDQYWKSSSYIWLYR